MIKKIVCFFVVLGTVFTLQAREFTFDPMSPGGVYSIDYSMDGARYVTSDFAGRVSLYDAESNNLLYSFKVDEGLRSARCLGEGRELLVNTEDGMMIYDTVLGEPLRHIYYPDPANDLGVAYLYTLSPDETTVALFTGKNFLVIDVATGDEINRYKRSKVIFEANITAMDFFPDNRTFVVGGWTDGGDYPDRCSFAVVGIEEQKRKKKKLMIGTLYDVAVVDEEDVIVATSNSLKRYNAFEIDIKEHYAIGKYCSRIYYDRERDVVVGYSPLSNKVHFWDRLSGDEVGFQDLTPDGREPLVTTYANGKFMSIGLSGLRTFISGDKYDQIEEVLPTLAAPRNIQALDDGSLIIFTDQDFVVRAKGNEFRQIDLDTIIDKGVASPSGDRIWVRSLEGDLVCYSGDDLAYDYEIKKLKDPRLFRVSPDGTWLAVVEKGKIHVYDAETGELQKKISAHGTYCSDALFSKDESRLVSIGMDRKLKYWDTSSWKRVEQYKMNGYPTQLFLSSDGEQIGLVHWKKLTGPGLQISTIPMGSGEFTLRHEEDYNEGAFRVRSELLRAAFFAGSYDIMLNMNKGDAKKLVEGNDAEEVENMDFRLSDFATSEANGLFVGRYGLATIAYNELIGSFVNVLIFKDGNWMVIADDRSFDYSSYMADRVYRVDDFEIVRSESEAEEGRKDGLLGEYVGF